MEERERLPIALPCLPDAAAMLLHAEQYSTDACRTGQQPQCMIALRLPVVCMRPLPTPFIRACCAVLLPACFDRIRVPDDVAAGRFRFSEGDNVYVRT